MAFKSRAVPVFMLQWPPFFNACIVLNLINAGVNLRRYNSMREKYKIKFKYCRL